MSTATMTPSVAECAALQTIEFLVGTWADQFPELSLSFGYIGNLGPYGRDDRSWRVFSNRTSEAGTNGRSVSLHLGSYEQMVSTKASELDWKLAGFCRRATSYPLADGRTLPLNLEQFIRLASFRKAAQANYWVSRAKRVVAWLSDAHLTVGRTPAMEGARFRHEAHYLIDVGYCLDNQGAV